MTGDREAYYRRLRGVFDDIAKTRGGYYDAAPQSKQRRHTPWQRLNRIHIRNLLAPLVGERSLRSCLDVGCGMGDFSHDLSQRFGFERVHGVDLSPAVVEVARARYGPSVAPTLSFSVEDAAAGLSFADRELDLVCCLNVFHHLLPADQEAAIGHLCRVASQVVLLEVKRYHILHRLLTGYRAMGHLDIYAVHIPDVVARFAEHGFQPLLIRPDLLHPRPVADRGSGDGPGGWIVTVTPTVAPTGASTAGRRELAIHATLAVALTVIVALYLGWPSLVRADRFHENWRQVPQWQSPDKQRFQEDDLILRYSEFGTSPFGNALYKTLARSGHDIVWGKVMTIVVFALGALSCFLAANAMSGLVAGWVAVFLFLFFPSMYEHFVGGFMAAFSWPLLGLAVLVIYRQLWWWAIPLVAFSAFTYPMVGLHIGMMYVVDTVYHDVWTGRLRDRELWRTKLLPLALAAVAVIAILGAKYFEDHGFGELVRRADMQDRIEFTSDGRYRILPTTDLWTRFERHWENSFHFPLLLVAVLFLGRSAFRMPRGVYSLLVASIIMYSIADYFVMQLYLPSRYIRRSLPLFACLVGGIWWARIYANSLRFGFGKAPGRRQKLRRLAPLTILTVVLIGLGAREFADELEPGVHTRVFSRHGPLPGDP